MRLSRSLKLVLICGALTTLAACGKDEPPPGQPDPQPDAQAAPPASTPVPAGETAPQPAPPPPPTVEEEPDEFEEFVSDVEKGLTLAMTLKAAIEQTYDSRGELPKSSAELPSASRIVPAAGNGVESLTVEDGVIVVDYAARGEHSGGTIRISPTADADGIEWDCSGGTLAAEYRPEECR